MRADARRNAEKLRAAAAELFRARGLEVPLKEIARRAGVSHGTLYNIFGTRENLIDEVVTDRAAALLEDAGQRALAADDPWEGFAGYVETICELQATDFAVADLVAGRFPDAERLMTACEQSRDVAHRITARARDSGDLRSDFTDADLVFTFAANAMLARATAHAAPGAWRRQAAFVLDGLRARAAGDALPAPEPTPQEVRDALAGMSGAPAGARSDRQAGA